MATYEQIRKYVKEEYNESVKTCWIAHVKEMNGIVDKNTNRQNPCPNNKIKFIENALQHFAMI